MVTAQGPFAEPKDPDPRPRGCIFNRVPSAKRRSHVRRTDSGRRTTPCRSKDSSGPAAWTGCSRVPRGSLCFSARGIRQEQPLCWPGLPASPQPITQTQTHKPQIIRFPAGCNAGAKSSPCREGPSCPGTSSADPQPGPWGPRGRRGTRGASGGPGPASPGSSERKRDAGGGRGPSSRVCDWSATADGQPPVWMVAVR